SSVTRDGSMVGAMIEAVKGLESAEMPDEIPTETISMPAESSRDMIQPEAMYFDSNSACTCSFFVWVCEFRVASPKKRTVIWSASFGAFSTVVASWNKFQSLNL